MMKPSSIVGSLQKQIPKKPPPPTPADVNPNHHSDSATQQSSNNGHNNDSSNSAGLPSSQAASSNSLNNTSSNHDQKPALPPRPVNQFNPIQQHQHQQASQQQQQPYLSALASKPSLLNHLSQQHQHHQPHSLQSSALQQPPIREQARVVYAYKPNNEDELAMEVGDIINVLDKDIEDAGWWKGELNGNIGVFPDNFVELITTPTPPIPPPSALSTTPPSTIINNNNNNHNNANNNINQSNQNSIGNSSNSTNNNPTTSNDTPTSSFAKNMVKMKLEENFEKQYLNNNAFYSLKRNKMQPQMSLPNEPISASIPVTSATPLTSTTTPTTPSATDMTDSADRFREIISNINDNLDPSTKLNHMTANRPKGPNRRPPSDFMKMRHQSETDHLHHTNHTQQTNSPISHLHHVALSGSSRPQQLSSQQQIPIATLPNQLSSQVAPATSSHPQQQSSSQQVSFASFNELKSLVEQLRVELKETRSEMDHHKRYIKEIVSILADERKKFVAIDQGLNRSF